MGDCISTIKGHSDAVISVPWSNTSMLLASASNDITVKIWDPATGQCISTFNNYSAMARVAWFSGQSLTSSHQSQELVHSSCETLQQDSF
jgi:WD40 repeat protein